jgi:hypothetical protein
MTSEAMCRFTFPTSEPALPGQPLTVSIEALDSEGNKGIGTVTLALSVAPTVTKVEPLEGPAYGGTELTVTGTNFVPGTELLIDGVVAPLVPNGLENGVVLRARTPPHEPGFVDVTVRAGSATVEAPSKFRYVGQPVVLAVAPSQGPVTGGTRVAIVGKNFREGATRIFFGTFDGMDLTELVCPKFVGASRFEGFTPPGMGASSIFVFDPIGGQSDLRTAFTYLDVDTPAAVPPGPPPCREGPP